MVKPNLIPGSLLISPNSTRSLWTNPNLQIDESVTAESVFDYESPTDPFLWCKLNGGDAETEQCCISAIEEEKCQRLVCVKLLRNLRKDEEEERES